MSATPVNAARRPPREHLLALGGLAAAVLLDLGYIAYCIAAYGLGTPSAIGPGAYPAVGGVFLLIGLVALGVQFLRGTLRTEPREVSESHPLRGVALLAATVGYSLIVPYSHIVVANVALALSVLLIMRARPLVAVVAAVGLGVGAYLLFVVILGVALGEGSTIW